jgi:hypothetical protein
MTKRRAPSITPDKILAIAVVIGIVSLILYYAGTRGEGTGTGGTGLPVYPGGSKVDISQLVPGVTVEAYDVAAPLEDVAAWYENEMSTLGWSKENEYTQGGIITVGWKKNSDGAGIMVITKEKQLIEEYAALFEDNILHLYRGSWNSIKTLLFPSSI